MSIQLVFIILCFLFAIPTWAELSATQPSATESQSSNEYETVVEDVIFNSSSKVVIDEKTIQQSKAPDLVSLITTQANVTLFNNNFQPPQLFLRGGESSHILILIDGVPTYDVSWAQRTLNLNSLDLSNVKRIEIIKGGQTVLHGGQALAGVIKIETFGSELKNEGRVSVMGSLPVDPFDKGLLDDRRLGVGIERAPSENKGYKVSTRVMQRQNQSPVLHSKKTYDQWNHNLDLGFENRGATTTRLRGFYFKDKSWNPTTVNGMSGQSVADADVQREDEQYGVSGQFVFNELFLKPKISFFAQQGERYFYSGPESENVDIQYKSGLHGLLLDTEVLNSGMFTVLAGASYQKEDFYLDDSKGTLNPSARKADVFSELTGVYTLVRVSPSDLLLFETGARHEKASGFAERQSYQIGLTLMKNTKLEWVTGYRTPSSAQKHGVFPNPNIEPETSQTYSITQNIPLGDKGEFSATVFETSFDNYIEVRSLGFGVQQYQNTAKVKTRGVETSASYILNEKQNVQMSYAYQEPWDQVRHEPLRRRPMVSGHVRFFHNEDKSQYMLEGAGVGQRKDFFISNRYTFPGYFLVNATYSYKLTAQNTLSLRVSNILDFRPEISIDYYGEGRHAWLTWDFIF